MKIERYDGILSPRERVLRTLNREKADRVPIGYDTNEIIFRKLAAALGVDTKRYDDMLDALGVDMRGVSAVYTGKRLHAERPNRMVDPMLGVVTRYVEHDSGGYWDFCDFPLKGADEETIAAFPVASADDFDYAAMRDSVKRYKGYSVYIGNAGTADIMNSLGRVMGVEDMLVNLAMEDEATLSYVDRYVDMQVGMLERMLDSFGEDVDVVWIGEDLGTQHTPMISMDMYRRTIKPRHQRYIDLAKAYGKKVLIHTCGASSWAYEEFIEMGIDAVDTLQPEATNMSPRHLVDHFGGRLAFRGCISTAGPLAYGTEADTEKVVRDTLEVMMPTHSYILAPTHSIQDNTPVENIVAMYNAAHRYGRYTT